MTMQTIPAGTPEVQSLTVPTPMHLIELAVQKGADADQLGKLMELQLKWQANEARLAYVAAMNQFKKAAPEITKTKKVSYRNKDNSLTEYSHPELDKITEVIGNALHGVGITHAWRTSDNAGKITVTCVLTHAQGHSEDVATLSGPADTSGGKNNVQAIGSTTTYLQRYTLLAGTGLAAEGQDDDGKTEGMDTNAIEDYSIQMQDSRTLAELKTIFGESYTKAKTLNDRNGMQTLTKVYEQRKKDLQ